MKTFLQMPLGTFSVFSQTKTVSAFTVTYQSNRNRCFRRCSQQKTPLNTWRRLLNCPHPWLCLVGNGLEQNNFISFLVWSYTLVFLTFFKEWISPVSPNVRCMYLSNLFECSPAHTATPESDSILQVCEGEGDGLHHTFFMVTEEGHHDGNKKATWIGRLP